MAGSYLWVSSIDNPPTVSKIDPTSDTAVGTVSLTPSVTIGKLCYYAGYIWVPCTDTNNVKKVDPVAFTVVATISVGTGPIACVGGGGSVWVTNSTGRSVSRIDPVGNSVTATITVG